MSVHKTKLNELIELRSNPTEANYKVFMTYWMAETDSMSMVDNQAYYDEANKWMALLGCVALNKIHDELRG